MFLAIKITMMFVDVAFALEVYFYGIYFRKIFIKVRGWEEKKGFL